MKAICILVLAAAVPAASRPLPQTPKPPQKWSKRAVAAARQEMPSFRGTIECQKGESTKPVLSQPGSSQVIGHVACGEEVTLLTTEVKLSKSGGSLMIEPVPLRTYSETGLYTPIAYGRAQIQGWVDSGVRLLPNQDYEILILGKAIDRSVCGKHGGYRRTEPPEKADPLRIRGRFAVCKDGSRIRVE
jgi:hypothetical protein